MEGKWTTNYAYFYFGKVNYSWKLYCRLAVPKVALRRIFLSLWALGVTAKWVAITFGTFPLQIQCPAPTYFSGTKYLVDLSKAYGFPNSSLSHSTHLYPALKDPRVHSCYIHTHHAHTHTYTQSFRGSFLTGSRSFILRYVWLICL